MVFAKNRVNCKYADFVMLEDDTFVDIPVCLALRDMIL
jgi:hypothetical protein